MTSVRESMLNQVNENVARARDAARERREQAQLRVALERAQPHASGAFAHGRRRFLRGAGGLTLALPFLEIMRGHKAHAAAGKPRRFIVWHQGQGTQFDEWAIPGSSPTDFRLGRILEPIAPWKDRMMFFRGIDNRVKNSSGGNGHQSAQNTCLTCQPNGKGSSFDQVLSARIKQSGQRSSLNLAVGPSMRIRFYAGAGDQIESQGDPRKAMMGLFTTDDQSGKELERLNARRKSILDAVKDNFTSFRGRLGQTDRQRLDQHADKLRELEVRFMQQSAVACAPPKINLPPSFNPSVDEVTSAEAQIEIIAMAFACNLTPVASLEFTNDWDPPQLGVSGWHDKVHAGEGKRGVAGLATGYRWYSERFAKLLARLSEVQDENGPLLDSTLVQWTCDFGYGAGHNGNSVHAAFAGTLGAGVPMGRLFNIFDPEKLWHSSTCTLNNYYVTILQAFGQPDTTFGSQADGSIKPGPIPGVF